MDDIKNLFDNYNIYSSKPEKCGYLPDLFERKILVELSPENSPQTLYGSLLLAGFRRSGRFMYRPFCDNCAKCISIRIPVNLFKANKTQKRILKNNNKIIRNITSPYIGDDHFALYQKYINSRHNDGEMSKMSFSDVENMVSNSTIDTIMTCYYEYDVDNKTNLIGWVLNDLGFDGISMVYSVFDPKLLSQSFGSYAILNHISLAIELGYPYLYLGYWIDNCKAMSYKINFKPYEILVGNNWTLHI